MSASRAVGCRLTPVPGRYAVVCRGPSSEHRGVKSSPPAALRGTGNVTYSYKPSYAKPYMPVPVQDTCMHAVEEMCILYARWRRIDPTRHKRTCGGHCVLSVGVELLALPHFKTRQMTSLASRARPSHPAWPQVQLQRRAGDMISLAQIGHVGGHHRYHLLLTLRRK